MSVVIVRAKVEGIDYYYQWDWTVRLATDLDMNNVPMDSIDISSWKAFEGNGHTISNVVLNDGQQGLFNFGVRSINDLIIDNIVVNAPGAQKVGAVADEATCDNVTVRNASVTGGKYVGGLVGKGSSFTGCSVEDSTVIGTGKTAGGLVGYSIGDPDRATVEGNSVKNVTVTGAYNVGGLLGQAQNETVEDNTVSNVVVFNTEQLPTGHDSNEVLTGAIVARGDFKNTIIGDNEIIGADPTSFVTPSDDTGLEDLIDDDANIYLEEGEYNLPSLDGTEGMTIIGAKGAVIGGEDTSTGFGSNFGKNTTIENLTFKGSTNGVRNSYANGGTSVFNNCTFAGDSTYGFHIDQSNGATFIFNECTFIGFNAFASDLVKVTFNDCTFLSNGNCGHTNIWSVGEFNNCIWGDDTSVGTRGEGKLYFDGTEETFGHHYIGSIDSLGSFRDSVNDDNDPEAGGYNYKSWAGWTVYLLNDIDLGGIDWEPIGGFYPKVTEDRDGEGVAVITEFRGTFDGNGHSITNLNVSENEAYAGLFGKVADSGVIKNLIVENVTVSGTSCVGAVIGSIRNGTVTDVHVTGLIEIEGHYKVGGIIGEGYFRATDCSVTADPGSFVKATYRETDLEGDNVGGFAGFTGEGEKTISDISVSGLSVEGTRKVGGILGTLHEYVSLIDSSVEGCNISSNASAEYVSAENEVIKIGGIVGEYHTGTSISGSIADTTVTGKNESYTDGVAGGNRDGTYSLDVSQVTTSDVIVTIDS